MGFFVFLCMLFDAFLKQEMWFAIHNHSTCVECKFRDWWNRPLQTALYPSILTWRHWEIPTRCLQSIERLPMLLSPPALTSHVARRIKCSPWSFYLFSSMFPRSFSPLSVFQSKCHLSFFYREWIACHSLPSYSAILWLWCWERVDRRVIYWIILFYNNF